MGRGWLGRRRGRGLACGLGEGSAIGTVAVIKGQPLKPGCVLIEESSAVRALLTSVRRTDGPFTSYFQNRHNGECESGANDIKGPTFMHS